MATNLSTLNRKLSSIGSGKYSIGSLNKSLESFGSDALGKMIRSPMSVAGFLTKTVTGGKFGLGLTAKQKTPANVLDKMYKFMKKSRDEDVRKRELENSFKEEQQSEENQRYERLLSAIKTYTKVQPQQSEEQSDNDKKSWAKNLLESIGGWFKRISSWALKLLSSVGGFFVKFISKIGALIVSVIKSILKPLAIFIVKKVLFGTVTKLLFGIFGRLVLMLSPYLLAIAAVMGAAELMNRAVQVFVKGRAFGQASNRLAGNDTAADLAGKVVHQKRTIDSEMLKQIESTATKKGDLGAKDFLKRYTPEALTSVRKGEKVFYNVPLLSNGREVMLPLTNTEAMQLSHDYDVVDKYTETDKKEITPQLERDYVESQLGILQTIKSISQTSLTGNQLTKKEEVDINNAIPILKSRLKLGFEEGTVPSTDRAKMIKETEDIADPAGSVASVFLDNDTGKESIKTDQTVDQVDTEKDTVIPEKIPEGDSASGTSGVNNTIVSNSTSGSSSITNWNPIDARNSSIFVASRDNYLAQ